MDFIVENYLWFGIAGVVLLMALIGFLAEKTDFITGETEKEEKHKKNRKKKSKKKEESIDDYDTDRSFALENNQGNSQQNNSSEVLDFTNTSINDAEPTIKAAPLSIDDPWMQPDPMVEEEPSVVTNTGEDLSQPFGDQEVTPIIDKPVKEETQQVSSDEDVWNF